MFLPIEPLCSSRSLKSARDALRATRSPSLGRSATRRLEGRTWDIRVVLLEDQIPNATASSCTVVCVRVYIYIYVYIDICIYAMYVGMYWQRKQLVVLKGPPCEARSSKTEPQAQILPPAQLQRPRDLHQAGCIQGANLLLLDGLSEAVPGRKTLDLLGIDSQWQA